MKRQWQLRLVMIVIIWIAFVSPVSADFLHDFNEKQHVYDYAKILNPDLENELSEYTEKDIYVVTLTSDMDIEKIETSFSFKELPRVNPIDAPFTAENNKENSNSEVKPEKKNIPKGYGSILSYKDVGWWPDRKNGFKKTGLGICWPERAPDEPDWKKIWQEHACMGLPENFEIIELPFSWFGKNEEGRYDVAIPTNALVGKLYKDGDMWMYEDRDGYKYKVAPVNPEDPAYDWLNNQYHNPKYSVLALQQSTITMILHEKYGDMERLYGGSKGYPLPKCEGERQPYEAPININEGESIPLTGEATLNPRCKVIIVYQAGKMIIGLKDCQIDAKDLLRKAHLDMKDGAGSINRLVNLLTRRKFKCSTAIKNGEAKLKQNDFNAAKNIFLEAYNKCSDKVKFTAGYKALNIEYNEMDYSSAVKLGKEIFNEAKDEDIAENSLRIVILSLNHLNDCDAILKLAKQWEDSNDKEIAGIIDSCKTKENPSPVKSVAPAKPIIPKHPEVPAQPVVPAKPVTPKNPYDGYKEPSGNLHDVIKGKLSIGWDLYNKGLYSRSAGVASDVLKYFNSDKNTYKQLYKSASKLYILSFFKIYEDADEKREEQCNFWGNSMYLAGYFSDFHEMDEDIERAWDECLGETYKPLSSNGCTTTWPTNQGSKVDLNGLTDSCNLFEAIHPSMQRVVKDAEACCDGTLIKPELSEACNYAKEYSHLSDPGLNRKRCMGIFIIRAIATGHYIHDYFFPKNNCFDGTIGGKTGQYKGQCKSDVDYLFNSNALSLPCRPDRSITWRSDTDMSQNNCNLIAFPAHATLDIIKTGVCVDYSILVTSLLRAAGYSKEEVYTVEETIHATNLVKLPGDTKYHFVDTTGGHKEGIVFDGVVYASRDWSKSMFHCYNDMGDFKCPDKSQIYERFVT